MELVGLMLSRPFNSNNSNSNKWCNSQRPNLVHLTLGRSETSQTALVSLLGPLSLGKVLVHLLHSTSSSLIWIMELHSFRIRIHCHLFRNNSSHRWLLINWAGINNNNSSSSSNSSSSNNLLLLVHILRLQMAALLKVTSAKMPLKLLNLALLILAWWMMRS